MTNEEAREAIKEAYGNSEYTDEIIEALERSEKFQQKAEVVISMLRTDRDRLEDAIEKIRAEIDRQEKWLLQAGCTAYNVDIAFDAIKSVVAEMEA